MGNQPPHRMPRERRNAPRAYRRMYRELDSPYSLQSLSERLERSRPFTSSPLNSEMEFAGRRSNVVNQERPPRYKYTTTNHRRLSVHINPMRSNINELEIIPPEAWARYPNRYFTRWQADEPQIVITSDVELQTDDIPLSETTTTRVVNLFRPIIDDISFPSTEYVSETRTSYSPNIVADRGTQIPIFEAEEIIDLDQEDTDAINEEPEGSNAIVVHRENPNAINECDVEVIDLVTSDKSDSEDDAGYDLSHRLYSRPAFMPYLPASTLESRLVANRLIRHARNNKTIDVKWLYCLSCFNFPSAPVTGPCGHTRCSKCIKVKGPCPCGAKAARGLYVNTVIQNMLVKMLPKRLSRRGHSNYVRRSALNGETAVRPVSAVGMIVGRGRSSLRSSRSVHSRRFIRSTLGVRDNSSIDSNRTSYVGPTDPNIRMPMAPRVQFDHACGLMANGLLRDAIPHLARVAASAASVKHSARSHLSQVVASLSAGRDPLRIARELFGLVRLHSAGSWLRKADLECVLCYQTYVSPVTTPCGHTYCRTCIERALDYRKYCALCQRPLDGFDPIRTRETAFVRAALEAIDARTLPEPYDPNVIPIFVCTVAYPAIPCPLFIFDPRYWLMIRRVLESGTRRFGMVAYERDRRYSDYGTILQVCDCVQLEDGRSFLSTVGVSRFRVIERDVVDGCDVARIQPLTDINPTDRTAILNVRMLGSRLLCKALLWLSGMNQRVRVEIEAAFGRIPRFTQTSESWWETTDGPSWLWWLVAIMPLRSEIKVLILSTKNLMKRMMAVARTLEAIDQVAITTASTSECAIRSVLTNAEDWVERGS